MHEGDQFGAVEKHSGTAARTRNHILLMLVIIVFVVRERYKFVTRRIRELPKGIPDSLHGAAGGGKYIPYLLGSGSIHHEPRTDGGEDQWLCRLLRTAAARTEVYRPCLHEICVHHAHFGRHLVIWQHCYVSHPKDREVPFVTFLLREGEQSRKVDFVS